MVQAISLIKKLSPIGKLTHIQNIVERFNRDRARKGQPAVVLDKEMVEDFINSEPDEADANYDRIIQDIASQMPATTAEKLTNWRYMCMLLNARTHMRNVVSNAAMFALKEIKDTASAGMQALLIRDRSQRTTAVLTNSEADRALKTFAASDADAMRDALTFGGKQGDVTSEIEAMRTIFKTRWLEKTRQFGSNTLEKEDWWFLRWNYASTLAKVMKARGITAETFQENTKEAVRTRLEARQLAIDEAMEATFRTANSLSNLLTRLEKGGGSAISSAMRQMLVGGLMPFKRTPLNIIKTGVEYSPIGLLRSFSTDLISVAKASPANRSAAAVKAINNFSKALTGSSVFAIGMALRALGLVRGRDDDDDRLAYYRRDTGEQPYSMTIGDTSLTIDWISPSSMPFFMGVELVAMAESGGDKDVSGTVNRILESLTTVTDPVFQLSMLQGLNKALSTYSDNKATAAIIEGFKSYLQQYIPSAAGQLARTVDPTRRSTYAQKNAPLTKGAAQFGRQVANKLPGVSLTSEAYLDKWGREQVDESSAVVRVVKNMISPSYISEDKTTPVDTEVQRVQKLTGNSGVIPGDAESTRALDGVNYYQNPDELTDYQQLRGQTSYDVLADLFTLGGYKQLDAKTQAKIIQSVYTYATDISDANFFKGRDVEYPIDKATQDVATGEKAGLSPAQILLFRALENELTADKGANGKAIPGTKKIKVEKLIASMNVSERQQQALMLIVYPDSAPTLPTRKDDLPKRVAPSQSLPQRKAPDTSPPKFVGIK
jgi:hypothetical protein